MKKIKLFEKPDPDYVIMNSLLSLLAGTIIGNSSSTIALVVISIFAFITLITVIKFLCENKADLFATLFVFSVFILPMWLVNIFHEALNTPC